jgi:hypothetical protein
MERRGCIDIELFFKGSYLLICAFQEHCLGHVWPNEACLPPTICAVIS